MHTVFATCEIEQLIKCRIFKSLEEEKKSFKSSYCLLALVSKRIYVWYIVLIMQTLCRLRRSVHGFKKLNLWLGEIRFVTLDQSKNIAMYGGYRLYRVFHVNFSFSSLLICETLKEEKKTSTTMLTWLECYPRSSLPTSSILSPQFSLSHVCLFRLFISVTW